MIVLRNEYAISHDPAKPWVDWDIADAQSSQVQKFVQTLRGKLSIIALAPKIYGARPTELQRKATSRPKELQLLYSHPLLISTSFEVPHTMQTLVDITGPYGPPRWASPMRDSFAPWPKLLVA